MNDDTCSSNSAMPKGDQAKPYSSPTLTDFGTIARLTRQFGPGPASDSGNNQMAPVS